MSVWNFSLLVVAKKLHVQLGVHICSLDNISQGPFPCPEFHHTPSPLATTGLETEKCTTPIAVCDQGANVWLLATAEHRCSKAACTALKYTFTIPYHASFARTEMRLQKSHRYEKHGYSRDLTAEALVLPPLTPSASCPWRASCP